jgi:hypothetical protein
MAARKLKGAPRTFWTLTVVLLPPVGAIFYHLSKRGNSLHHATFQ